VLVLLAGVVTGGLNAAVGSGSLVTFPALLAIGLPPVTANVTNTVGLVLGSVSGAVGYRAELAPDRRRVAMLGLVAAIGGVAGAVALLRLPSSSFRELVPLLLASAVLLVLAEPFLRRPAGPEGASRHRVALPAAVVAISVYAGYFGVAGGVVLLAVLPRLLGAGLQHANGVKNVLMASANGAAAVLFLAVADVRLALAGLLAVGSAVGGRYGARLARALPDVALRLLVAAAGVAGLVLVVAR
jgi:uncharacterized membrane protein YfcA